MNEPFVKGMKIVTKSLREDEDYFRAWQANIAMAFVDEARNQKARIGFDLLHNIANTAASNFLNMLIKEKEKKARSTISEGKFIKGGKNIPPQSPRPDKPKAQGAKHGNRIRSKNV
jgi:hypothetical protein